MADLVERQAAIDAVVGWFCDLLGVEEISEDLGCLARLRELPSAQPEHECRTCRYNHLEWFEEPCDSCTGGGESNHWKPKDRGYIEQIKWERDIAIQQLKEFGCEFGEQPMPSANDALEDAYAHGYTYAESKFREMLDTRPEIIYCKDCVHHIDGFFCRQANHHTSDKDHCASVFGAERREE